MSEVALVTGASSGIGAEFATQLSAGGYEVIMVARRSEPMEQLAERLSGPTHIVPCDLANDASSLVGKVAELGRQVDLLVTTRASARMDASPRLTRRARPKRCA